MTANKKPEIKNNDDVETDLKNKVLSKSVSCRVYVYLCVQCNALISSLLMRTTSTANSNQINLCARTHIKMHCSKQSKQIGNCVSSSSSSSSLSIVSHWFRDREILLGQNTHKKITIEIDQMLVHSTKRGYLTAWDTFEIKQMFTVAIHFFQWTLNNIIIAVVVIVMLAFYWFLLIVYRYGRLTTLLLAQLTCSIYSLCVCIHVLLQNALSTMPLCASFVCLFKYAI